MRLCRFKRDETCLGLFYDEKIIDLKSLYKVYSASRGGQRLPSLEPFPSSLLPLLPPNQSGYEAAKTLERFYQGNRWEKIVKPTSLSLDDIKLLAPISRPQKFFLLAGNYAEHIEEGGGKAEEKERTFPYFFMKPSTTITNPGDPIILPSISPNCIDWEVELGVVIGRKIKGIPAKDALSVVAGYTIVVDVSDRNFKPNPKRRKRPMDDFFDWLHGKWHDTFAPMGPCITSSENIPDPQNLHLTLQVNGKTMQNSNTNRMIFSVAELIEFISGFVTLEPGDIISTGTPAGIGATTGTFLKPGDIVNATIGRIGTLQNPVQ